MVSLVEHGADSSSPAANAWLLTGSVAVGKRIASVAIGNLTKLQMEMGSKNAMVVLDDCDLDLAAAARIGSAKGLALTQNVLYHRLAAAVGKEKVNKAGAGNLRPAY